MRNYFCILFSISFTKLMACYIGPDFKPMQMPYPRTYGGLIYNYMLGKELLSQSGFGLTIGKEKTWNSKFHIAYESGYFYNIGKQYGSVKWSNYHQIYLHLVPTYYFTKSLSLSVSLGTHFTFRHYLLNEHFKDYFNTYKIRLGYRYNVDRNRTGFTVSCGYAHYRAGNFIMNYVEVPIVFNIYNTRKPR